MINRINYFFLILLIVFLPFQSLAQNFLGRFTDNAFWLAHWYEPLLIFMLLFSSISIIKNFSKTKMLAISVLILFFAFISALLTSSDFGRGIEGIRFSLIYLLVFMLAQISNLNQKQSKVLVNSYLITASIVACWAIVERFLPLNYWQVILNTSFGWGNFLASDYQRSASVLGGPNQLGSYLIPAVFIVLSKIKNNKSFNTVYCLLTTVYLFAIFFSFSRAAWLGLAAGLFVFIFLKLKSNKAKTIYLGIWPIIAAFLYSIYWFGNDKIKEFLTHGESQYWHMLALKESWDYYLSLNLTEKIFGHGIGSAGPAALKYGDGLISESWYFQLLIELGILGFALWISLILLILINLYKNKQVALLSGLIGILTTSLFLHTFADNPALTITLFILVGATLEKKGKS